MTPIEGLHSKVKEMMVKDHLELLSSQYLASAMQVSHPSHAVVTLPQGPRQKKETLYLKCIGNVQQHLTNGLVPEHGYKKIVSSLHSAAVAKAIFVAGPNWVLSRYPPSAGVDPSEETLTRPHRCALAQLCQGYCHRLQSYQHKIGKSPNDLCPECGVSSHTCAHLFKCPAFPTDIRAADLWYRPRKAAVFVSNLPSFVYHLPPVAPFPPRIPPDCPP
jgi:hypothetical protein